MTKLNISDNNKIYELALSHITSRAITLAGEMRLDKALSEYPISVDKLAIDVKFNSQALYRLLRVLDLYEIVELVNNHEVKAGKLLPYLNRIISPHLLDSYSFIGQLEDALKNNSECYSTTFGKTFYLHLRDNPSKLEQFKLWCTQSAKDWLPSIFSLYDFSKFNTLVDVGGGEGYFLASLLRDHPWQKGILFDQPEVVTKASTIFAEYDVQDRADAVGGDFFKSIPAGGDAYMICRTLLNWDDKDALSLINNCHNFMEAKSSLLIIDFVMPEKNHPQYKIAVLNDVNLLACINSSNRTESQWRALIENSQFRLKKVYITNTDTEPQPILPMIILEAEA